MAGYWPFFFLRVYGLRRSRAIKIALSNQTKNTMLHKRAKLNLTQSQQQSKQDIINGLLGWNKAWC